MPHNRLFLHRCQRRLVDLFVACSENKPKYPNCCLANPFPTYNIQPKLCNLVLVCPMHSLFIYNCPVCCQGALASETQMTDSWSSWLAWRNHPQSALESPRPIQQLDSGSSSVSRGRWPWESNRSQWTKYKIQSLSGNLPHGCSPIYCYGLNVINY